VIENGGFNESSNNGRWKFSDRTVNNQKGEKRFAKGGF